MDTGEIIALVIVILILLAGSMVIGLRCCRSAITIIKEKNEREKFYFNVCEGLRRSVRRWSFMRAGRQPPPNIPCKPVTNIATIEVLHQEKSELHPKYMTNRNTKTVNLASISATDTSQSNATKATPKITHVSSTSDKRDDYGTNFSNSLSTDVDECKVHFSVPKVPTVITTSNVQCESIMLENSGGVTDTDMMPNDGSFANLDFDMGYVVKDEEGGFENPGYVDIDGLNSPKNRLDLLSVNAAQRKYSITSTSTISVDLTDVPDYFTQEDEVSSFDEVGSSFRRFTPNRASLGALRARPGKVSEHHILNKQSDCYENDMKEKKLVATCDVQDSDMFPVLPDDSQQNQFIHACYNITGTGVVLNDHINTDSFI